MTWYLQSAGDHDTHHSDLRRGKVLATHGVELTAAGVSCVAARVSGVVAEALL